MITFFGFYCGVPMTSQTPPETLLRAAVAAEEAAMNAPTMKDAAGFMETATAMRACAVTR